MSTEMKRIGLTLSETTYNRVKKISDLKGCSIGEAIRRAFSLYETVALANQKDPGLQIIFKRSDGTLSELIASVPGKVDISAGSM